MIRENDWLRKPILSENNITEHTKNHRSVWIEEKKKTQRGLSLFRRTQTDVLGFLFMGKRIRDTTVTMAK